MGAPEPTDTGLQPERTSLSFVRTSVSILGLVVACLRWLPPGNATALVGPAIVGTLVAGVTVHEHRSRTLRMTRFAAESATPAIGAGALLAVSVVLLSLSGLWILVY
ncbi:uncharacterized protein DUF202 [Rhodococcus wratislaviensis]|uniref:DUF202 domain-containing protein n=2 Tax=Rhodococcus wratislaviensis TaxID=44752 RepID=A0AB38F657_RHOWR|nr:MULTISPECIES: DUF202 domain-containing protein [Rhodococcus]REE70751.1 uncharacterized protein DUF202 [Rhodococcus wratislaviensis]WAM14827.1 DUF202 domain-containing protein [Rhodococcus sp. JS3073]GAF45333.1 hypothetical protein RW1_019_00850 [Rhodococcus wratislaviensis NBRC 100605]SPZ34866.1 Uncharacterised protein [Rhodococcus wratislaviensis]